MWLKKKQAPDSATMAVLARADEMASHTARAPHPHRPSAFWRDISQQNIAMLEAAGVEHFKRYLPQNYFNWVVEGMQDPNFRALILSWTNSISPLPLEVELFGDAELYSINGTEFVKTPAAARAYTLFVGLLWWRATETDASKKAVRLVEPAIGDPVPISHGGRLISQDLANSLREYNRFAPHLTPRPDDPRPVLAELGAGYGRLGYATLRAQSARYWIFDVAPALAVSEWYLSQAVPGAKIFKWRKFSTWSEVADEALAADICIFTSDQLDQIPPNLIRVFAAISVLHELSLDQIDKYMDLMGKLSDAIYVKNWTVWQNTQDNVYFESAELPIPKGWGVFMKQQDDVIADFTEILLLRDG